MKTPKIAQALALCALAAFSASVLGQSKPLILAPTAADKAAAQAAKHNFISVLPMASLNSSGVFRTDSSALIPGANGGEGGPHQYPGDLGYNGGATIATAHHHAVYLYTADGTCLPPTLCWGNVEPFLSDLNVSNFLHITDQYVHSGSGHRYPVGSNVTAEFLANPGTLTDADMQAILHFIVIALNLPTGYGNIYHLFLAPGLTECIDSALTICSNNFFCAYHGSAVFPDIGETVYTLEPYIVGVGGCSGPAASPNGGFDTTYSVLSHETFETITDPDGSAWFNNTNSGLLGSEIGDECLFWLFDQSGNFISTNPIVQTLNGHKYLIQSEYNNAMHSCTIHTGD